MAKLTWDNLSDKSYEIGLEKGVLYLQDNSGVSWNGLVSVSISNENLSNDPIYYDGRKIFDLTNPGDLSAKITAVTYPEEFSFFTGVSNFNNGLFIANQSNQTFGLSYKTFSGFGENGGPLNYKIHILYNLTANADEINYETINDSVNPINFSWTVFSTPQNGLNHRPSSYFILDSQKTHPQALEIIENILYGTQTTDARLPSISELLSYVKITITDNGDGTWTAEGPNYFITMLNASTFQIEEANAKYITSNSYSIASSNVNLNG